LAERFATTPNQYAKAVVTSHLLGGKAESPPEQALNELGEFLRQIRDEFQQEAERQRQRLDALAARVNTLISHTNALTKRVLEVDQRLANFLERVDPV
jgi:hypothetical protein